jgi:hypothetical protein
MRVKNFGFGMPRELHDTQEWFCAIDAFDFADPQPLTELILSGTPIPPAYKQAIADIIAGVRKPNKKAAAKLKVPARERMHIACGLSILLGLNDVLKRGSERIAERKCVEPIEVIRRLEKDASKLIKKKADQYDISVETVENLLRDLRKKAEKFPIV